jgi:hypothetical protein
MFSSLEPLVYWFISANSRVHYLVKYHDCWAIFICPSGREDGDSPQAGASGRHLFVDHHLLFDCDLFFDLRDTLPDSLDSASQ